MEIGVGTRVHTDLVFVTPIPRGIGALDPSVPHFHRETAQRAPCQPDSRAAGVEELELHNGLAILT